jgi:glyoxylase-like metal-dependent hydrolase (beta-lactamase superfamily II)
MSIWQSTNISISRVVDIDRVPFAASAIYPNATTEAMRGALAGLGSDFVDPSSFDLLLSFHGFVVRTRHHTVLVDACVGNDKNRPTRPAWHRRSGSFLDNLTAIGVHPETVDFVLCTHLHADHVGWNTRLLDGRWVATFPNAQYLIGKAEYEHWLDRYSGDAAMPVNYGSFEDSVLPVVRSGQAVMVPSNYAVEAGIYCEAAPGHTPGNLIIHVEDGCRRAILSGDVLHHPVQLAHPDWSTRFCSDADQSRQTRVDFLRRYRNTKTDILAAHFRTPTLGRIAFEAGNYNFLFGKSDAIAQADGKGGQQ